MLIASNIDRTDAVYNTNAPFTWDSALKLPDGTLPTGAFLSIKVQCTPDTPPPVRIASASIPGADSVCVLAFEAANGNTLGTLKLSAQQTSASYVTRYIRNVNGVIVGHAAYDPAAIGCWFDAAKKNTSKVYNTTAGDFMLLPQCHEASFTGRGRALVIDGKLVHCDAIVEFDSATFNHRSTDAGQMVYQKLVEPEHRHYKGIIGVRLEHCEDSGHRLATGMDNAQPYPYTIYQIFDAKVAYTTSIYDAVGNFFVGGRHLVLRAGLKSNMRITTVPSENKIIFAQPEGLVGGENNDDAEEEEG